MCPYFQSKNCVECNCFKINFITWILLAMNLYINETSLEYIFCYCKQFIAAENCDINKDVSGFICLCVCSVDPRQDFSYFSIILVLCKLQWPVCFRVYWSAAIRWVQSICSCKTNCMMFSTTREIRWFSVGDTTTSSNSGCSGELRSVRTRERTTKI